MGYLGVWLHILIVSTSGCPSSFCWMFYRALIAKMQNLLAVQILNVRLKMVSVRCRRKTTDCEGLRSTGVSDVRRGKQADYRRSREAWILPEESDRFRVQFGEGRKQHAHRGADTFDLRSGEPSPRVPRCPSSTSSRCATISAYSVSRSIPSMSRSPPT